MARSAAGAELTRQHHADQLTIRAAVLRNLIRLWRAVDPTNLAATINPFAAAAAALVESGNRESASAAADYYRAFRAAEGVRGALAIALGPAIDTDIVAAALRAAGLAGIIDARRRGATVTAAANHGFVRAAGSASSLVLEGGRETVREAAASDPVALGWQRVTDENPCAFCAMLASRGPAYKSRAAASTVVGRRGASRGSREIGQAFHAHCGCEVEAVYEGSELPDRSREFQELWQRATPGLSGTDAVNAFRRAIEGRPVEGDPILAA